MNAFAQLSHLTDAETVLTIALVYLVLLFEKRMTARS
jgi:hypothetical protein